MSDLLNMEAINSLPHPLVGVFYGKDTDTWMIHDIDVETGVIRIDVHGPLDVRSFCELTAIIDADSNNHDPEKFWSDYESEINQ